MTARVVLEAGGHKVDILDDDASAATLVELVRALWTETDSPNIVRSVGAVGFVAEIPPQPQEATQP